MMPYTCIIKDLNGNIKTELVYGQFGAADTAEDAILEKEPSAVVIAAIPGDHVNKVWLGRDMDERRSRREGSMDVDVWEQPSLFNDNRRG